MRFRRVGVLKERTKDMLEALDEEIEKKEKALDALKKERTTLQRKLEEED